MGLNAGSEMESDMVLGNVRGEDLRWDFLRLILSDRLDSAVIHILFIVHVLCKLSGIYDRNISKWLQGLDTERFLLDERHVLQGCLLPTAVP